MDTNSPKPTETGLEALEAATYLRQWLEYVGGNQRIPQSLDLLVEQTLRELNAGHAAPALDADTLRKFHAEKYGGRPQEAPASRWLSKKLVTHWWSQRQAQLEDAFRQQGLALLPNLTTQKGGGRGNTTTYRLEFEPLPSLEDLPDDTEAQASQSLEGDLRIRYQTEPAKPALWLQPFLGKMPFRMRSWRGYLVIGLVLTGAFGLLALWSFLLLALRGTRQLQANDLGLFFILLIGTSMWWSIMKPIALLPENRITIANDFSLAFSQLNGQFRLSRDAQSKKLGGWFQLLRYWGNCPICSSEVEIAEGGKAFPGRLVGRCGDSPLEHVFSFDPVSLSGRLLY